MLDELAKLAPTNESVARLESYLVDLPQVAIRTEHKFAPGVYIRQITIPADTLMTGMACRQEHLSVMVRGRMNVLADGKMQELAGYNDWIAPAGVKRVGYAVEETVWFTVHANPENITDIERLENELWLDADNLLNRRLADGRAISTEAAPCLL